MLVISKIVNGNKTSYSYFTLDGYLRKQYTDMLEEMGGVPEDIIAILDDDNSLYKKIIEMTSFELVFDNKGKLVDVQEIISEVDGLVEEVNQLRTFLSNTDYQVIKNMEVLAVELANKYNIELPYNPVELHEERQVWRDKMEEDTELLSQMAGEQDETI